MNIYCEAYGLMHNVKHKKSHTKKYDSWLYVTDNEVVMIIGQIEQNRIEQNRITLCNGTKRYNERQ